MWTSFFDLQGPEQGHHGAAAGGDAGRRARSFSDSRPRNSHGWAPTAAQPDCYVIGIMPLLSRSCIRKQSDLEAPVCSQVPHCSSASVQLPENRGICL